jgi:hypothetical protein
VGSRAGLDEVEKRKFLTLQDLELRPLCRPARSQSLYQQRYPGSLHGLQAFQKIYKAVYLTYVELTHTSCDQCLGEKINVAVIY